MVSTRTKGKIVSLSGKLEERNEIAVKRDVSLLHKKRKKKATQLTTKMAKSRSLSLSFSFVFLLDEQDTAAQSTTGKQYVTVNEYLELKRQQQQTKYLLKSLQQQISILQQRPNENVPVNETSKFSNRWEQKYHDLQTKYKRLETGMFSVQNRLMGLTTKLTNLEDLVNTHVLQDIQKLKVQIKSIGAKTFILDSNERARNNDIFVLYNKTAESQKFINAIKILTTQRLEKIEHNQSETFSNIYNHIQDFSSSNVTMSDVLHKIDLIDNRTDAVSTELENRMQKYELKQNMTEKLLIKRAADTNEKVAVTACASYDGVRNGGETIKFDEIRSHIGISNLAVMRSSGTFTCEKAGLYHVSAVINGPTANGQFSIHVNGNTLSTLRISSDNTINTGTAVLAVELQSNDIVSVAADSKMHVYFHWSCMTIVKIQ